MQRKATLYIVRIAMMSALSFALMNLKVSFFPPFNFFKFELSNVPVVLVSLAMGPWSGALVALIKNLIYLPMDLSSVNLGVGVLSNFILSATYALTVGYVYKFFKGKKGAAISLGIGGLSVTTIACFSNWFLIFPLFKLVIGFDVKAVFGFYAIYAGVIPHNLILTTTIALITFFVYKSLSRTVLKGDTMFGIGKKHPLKPPIEEETINQDNFS